MQKILRHIQSQRLRYCLSVPARLRDPILLQRWRNSSIRLHCQLHSQYEASALFVVHDWWRQAERYQAHPAGS